MKSRIIKPEQQKNIKNSTAPKMTLYEMNQAICSQLPPLSSKDKVEATFQLIEWLGQNKSRYFMLLSREKAYYTVFNFISKTEKNIKTMAEDIFECARNIGILKSINLTEDKSAFEIWIDDAVYYLFPYEQGVIEYDL